MELDWIAIGQKIYSAGKLSAQWFYSNTTYSRIEVYSLFSVQRYIYVLPFKEKLALMSSFSF